MTDLLSETGPLVSLRQVAEYRDNGGDIWRLRMYRCDACDRVCIGTGHHAFCPHCREKMGRDDK